MNYFKLWHIFTSSHIVLDISQMKGESPVGPQTKLRATGFDDYVNQIAGGHTDSFFQHFIKERSHLVLSFLSTY